MKRIITSLIIMSSLLISAMANADDINFLVNNKVDGADGARPQVLFIVDVLSTIDHIDNSDTETTTRKINDVASEGCMDVTTEWPTQVIQFLVPEQILFKGSLCNTGSQFLAIETTEILTEKYDEILTKDPREIVKFIMKQRPDIEYGVISLNDYVEPASYLTSAKLELEVAYRSDFTQAFNTISNISAHSADSTPITGGFTVAYDYLNGSLVQDSVSYSSPLDNGCKDLKLILLTNGGWADDLNLATATSLSEAVANNISASTLIKNYLPKVAQYLKNNEVKSSCDARVSTSVIGIEAPVTDDLFIVNAGKAKNVAQEMAENGDGVYLNAQTGGDAARAILNELNSIYPSPTTFTAPTTAQLMNRAANKVDAYATAFMPEQSAKWQGRINKETMDGQDDTNLDPIGDDDFAGTNFVKSKTASTRTIYTNIASAADGKTVTTLNSLIADNNTLITSADKAEYIKDLPDGLMDPIHFKPLVIDYGGDIGTRMIIGTNDGLLHMFDSNGNEKWAFLPKEMEKLVPALVDDNSAPRYSMVDHFYGIDGAPTAFVHDAPDDNGIRDGKIESGGNDKVYIFFGLRRGGATYYAMDVTAPDSVPIVKWRKGKMDLDYGGRFDIDALESRRDNEEKSVETIESEILGSGCSAMTLFNASDCLGMLVCDYNGYLKQYNGSSWQYSSSDRAYDPSSYPLQEPSAGIYFYYNGESDYGFTSKNQCLMDLSTLNKFTFQAHPYGTYSYEVTDPGKNKTCSSTTYLSISNGMILGKDQQPSPTEMIVGFDITSIPNGAYITSAKLTLAHKAQATDPGVYDSVVAVHGVNGFFGNDPGRNSHSTQDCTDKDVYFGDNGYSVYEYIGGIKDPGSPYALGERTADGIIFPPDLYPDFYTDSAINSKGIAALSKLFDNSVLHDTHHEISWVQFKVKLADYSELGQNEYLMFGAGAGQQLDNWKKGDNSYWDTIIPKLELTWTYDDPDPQNQISDATVEALMNSVDKDKFLEVRGEGTTPTDTDGDGVADSSDNCPTIANADQADSDSDGIGDVCDTPTDTDGDGVADSSDNCPDNANADQADSDSDGIGDVCDSPDDADGDGVADSSDNCPDNANADQADSDSDGIGDVCDSLTDSDGDGVADSSDAFPNDPTETTDSDGDGTGNNADECDSDPDKIAAGECGCGVPEGTCSANSCFTTTNSAHASAGRMYIQNTLYYVTGSNTYIGSSYVVSDSETSLEETSSGYWEKVDSCE